MRSLCVRMSSSLQFHRFRLKHLKIRSERTALRVEWASRWETCLNQVWFSDIADVDLCSCSNSPVWVRIRWKKNSVCGLLQNGLPDSFTSLVFSSPLTIITNKTFNRVKRTMIYKLLPCFVGVLMLSVPTLSTNSPLLLLRARRQCSSAPMSLSTVSRSSSVASQPDPNSWRQLHRPTCCVTWSPEQLPGFPIATMFLFLES